MGNLQRQKRKGGCEMTSRNESRCSRLSIGDLTLQLSNFAGGAKRKTRVSGEESEEEKKKNRRRKKKQRGEEKRRE